MPSTAAQTDRGPTIEEDLDELSSLLWETFRGLKQSSPPPQELRDAATRGSLGPRHMPALLAVAATGAGPVDHERDRWPAEPGGPARACRGRGRPQAHHRPPA